MKAVVFHGTGDVRLDTAPDPAIGDPYDVIVRITASAICGTDLHMVRGTMPGMVEGTILGHEGVGVVEETGPGVRNLRRGDRVVVPSTVGCGNCSYCRRGYTAQCDDANPNGHQAGTAFFGGPGPTGPLQGLQAEYARIPFGHVNLVRLPPTVTDAEALMLSDIAPTAWFGADIAGIEPGKSVAVWGCGPVGLFAIAAALHAGAGRVIAVDAHEDRLEMARALGAETVDFGAEDPGEAIMALTGGIGTDRAIEAVGVDAFGPDSTDEGGLSEENRGLVAEGAPESGTFAPGDRPSQSVEWALRTLAKAGQVGIVGVFPPQMTRFPIGLVQQRNLTVKAGNANHLKYVKELVGLTASGALKPDEVLTRQAPLTGVIEAYRTFDRRKPGWVKVALDPAA